MRRFSILSLNAYLLAAILLSVLCGSPLIPNSYAALTEKKFKQDMTYYSRLSRRKNLGANDRLYILDRLRKKYRQADFDLSDLFAEIDRWYTIKDKEAKSGKKKKSAVRKAIKAKGRLTKALVTEKKKYSRLILDVPGMTDYQDEWIQDDSGLNPPVIVLYLYQTREELKPTSKNFRIRNGIIRQVQSQTVASDPSTTKVSVALRKDRPYKISRIKEQLVLTVYKQGGEPKTKKVPPAQPVKPVHSFKPAGLTPVKDFSKQPGNQPGAPAVIRIGDILTIKVSGKTEFVHEAIVQPDGLIRIPLLGKIKAEGLQPRDLEGKISKDITKYIPDPVVNVNIKKITPKQIFLTGRVKSPGVYNLDGPLYCFELISKTGGFLKDADKKNIVLYRGTRENRDLQILDAEKYLSSSDPYADIPLEPGDVIEVPRTINFITLIGAVKSEGRYEIKENMKLLETIYLAGGFTDKAKLDQIRVIRSEHGKKTTREFNIKDVLKNHPKKNIVLKAGDLVVVPEKGVLKPKLFNRKLLPWTTFFISLGLILALLI